MTTLLIIVIVLGCLAILFWHRLGDPEQKPEQQLSADALREQQMRRDRVSLLNRAYLLAKEELGEEPTVEQVLLTRDQLKTQQELEARDGETG